MLGLEAESWIWYGTVITLGQRLLHPEQRNVVNRLRSASPICIQMASSWLHQELPGRGLPHGFRCSKRAHKIIALASDHFVEDMLHSANCVSQHFVASTNESDPTRSNQHTPTKHDSANGTWQQACHR
jgi:hypothetical protein